MRVDRFRPAIQLSVRRGFRYGISRSWVRPSAAVVSWRLSRPLRRVREVSYRRAFESFVAHSQGAPPRGASLEDGLRSLEVALEAETKAREGGELPGLASS